MHRWTAVTIGGLLLVAGCATASGDRVREDLYWDSAKACESRYRTIHIDRLDSDGNVSAHSDAETRGELQAFTSCYRDGLQKAVERRRQAGQPVPEDLKMEPDVDLE